MFNFFKPKRTTLSVIETVIGSNTSFKGHLKCDGNIRIDGVCEDGVIETMGNVVVSREGRVAAKIIAEHISVAGVVTGSIKARGRLEILSTGRVEGSMHVANFYKDDGGVLGGTLYMNGVQTDPDKMPSELARDVVDGEDDSTIETTTEKDVPSKEDNSTKTTSKSAKNN